MEPLSLPETARASRGRPRGTLHPQNKAAPAGCPEGGDGVWSLESWREGTHRTPFWWSVRLRRPEAASWSGQGVLDLDLPLPLPKGQRCVSSGLFALPGIGGSLGWPPWVVIASYESYQKKKYMKVASIEATARSPACPQLQPRRQINSWPSGRRMGDFSPLIGRRMLNTGWGEGWLGVRGAGRARCGV